MADDWRLKVGGVEVARFGSYESGIGLDTHPVVGATDVRDEDVRRPREDGIAMGADYLGATNVEFDFTVFASSYEEAVERRGGLRQAWRADAIRRTPGALAELWSHTGRVAFGRPRRFAQLDGSKRQDLLLRQGVAQAVADFEMADPNWYGQEQAVTVSFSRGVTTGFTFPAKFPWTTTGERETRGLVRVTGGSPTPLVIAVEGPIVNPVVEIGPLRFEASVSLAAGERLSVNAWPNRRMVTVAGRAAGGVLSSRSTRLGQAVLPPGDYEAVLRGTSESGTASLTVRWRDAFASW